MSFMEQARQEALRGRGRTSPNPIVGAVIVRGDVVVGRGFHAGGPHAEVVAIADAGDQANGATLFCTLEPCKHVGRTGPCTEAIINAGIARVIYAVADPTVVAGGGADVLRAAGVDVSFEANAQVAFDNRAWLHKAKTGRPYVIAKSAMTIDGRVAARDGTSKWITSAAARKDVAELRADVDAIVTGTGTVLADNPLLTIRGVERSGQPERLVVGTRPIPSDFQINSDHGFTPLSNPKEALALAEERGFNALLVESGPGLLTSLLAEDLIDEWWVYIAPLALGSGSGVINDLGITSLDAALKFEVVKTSLVGTDVKVIMQRGSDVHGNR